MTREYANKIGFYKIVEAWQNGHALQVRRMPKGNWENCTLRFAMDCDERDELRINPKDAPQPSNVDFRDPAK